MSVITLVGLQILHITKIIIIYWLVLLCFFPELKRIPQGHQHYLERRIEMVSFRVEFINFRNTEEDFFGFLMCLVNLLLIFMLLSRNLCFFFIDLYVKMSWRNVFRCHMLQTAM